MIAYKGFGPNLQCLGFQYEEGYTYKMDEKPIKSRFGFHACIMPIHILQHYDTNIVRKVEMPYDYLDVEDRLEPQDSKICGSHIRLLCDKIDIYAEQLKVMANIIKNSYSFFAIEESIEFLHPPYWIYLIEKEYTEYYDAFERKKSNDECSEDALNFLQNAFLSKGGKHFRFLNDCELKQMMVHCVDRFWATLITRFEDGINHTNFYKMIETLVRPVQLSEKSIYEKE